MAALREEPTVDARRLPEMGLKKQTCVHPPMSRADLVNYARLIFTASLQVFAQVLSLNKNWDRQNLQKKWSAGGTPLPAAGGFRLQKKQKLRAVPGFRKYQILTQLEGVLVRCNMGDFA